MNQGLKLERFESVPSLMCERFSAARQWIIYWGKWEQYVWFKFYLVFNTSLLCILLLALPKFFLYVGRSMYEFKTRNVVAPSDVALAYAKSTEAYINLVLIFAWCECTLFLHTQIYIYISSIYIIYKLYNINTFMYNSSAKRMSNLENCRRQSYNKASF